MKKIDVFLLAAGESSRMFPLSQIMEKSLLPVDGKPVIRHIVENLTQPEVAKHIRRIIICCLTKFKKQFEHEFRDMPSIEIMDFEKPIGTFSTFFLASGGANNLIKRTDYAMVHYADCLTEIDYVDFIKNHEDRNKYFVLDGMIAVTNQVKHDYSEVKMLDGHVHEFNEKPNLSNYTWSGIGIFYVENMHIKYKRNYEGDDFAFNIFPQMIADNMLDAYPYEGKWYDVGNLNSYRKICALYDGTNGNVKL